MPMIELAEAMKLAAADEFWAARGKAIQAYANLEQALCHVFADLSGTDLSTAGVIFFKITDSRARNAIIDKLFKKKFGARFNLFRNSLETQLRPLDIERNEIVHWNAMTNVGLNDVGKTTAVITLEPPAYWNRTPDTPIKSTADLIAFIQKCEFYARVCGMFHVVAATSATSRHNLPEDAVRTWLGVFDQSIVYPPPDSHPLSQSYKGPEIPIPPFRV